MTIIISILCILSLLLLAALIAVLRRADKASQTIADLRETNARLEAETSYAHRQCDQLRSIHAEETSKAEDRINSVLQHSEDRFRLLANELLSSHASRMSDRNQTDLSRLLTPLKDDIDKFRRDISTFYSKEAAERFSLQERIKELIEANDNISKQTRQLSSALRGNSKFQGDWGEIVLENILERSGLRPGEEFEIQSQRNLDGSPLKNDLGQSLRPDVVVKYPGGKAIVIDSKVSLTAFLEYVDSANDADRQRYGKLHLASVMKHINELSEKNYQDFVGSQRLDFVMMFIPNESAYTAAMTLDHSLWQKAYDKRVLIVSPTQLVASLRLVAQLWNTDRQTRNAIDIAERSGAMYDKFVGFVNDMEKIDRSLTATRTAYSSAMRKLRDGTGSLIVRAEKLRELGAKASKRLPMTDITDQT